MRLVKAELRKVLTSKMICVLFLVLLSANFLLTLYTSRPKPYEKTVREVYNEYVKSPEEKDRYFQELKLLGSLSFRDENFKFPHTYYGTDAYDDMIILRNMYEYADYINGGYESQITKITKLAKRKIDDAYGFNFDASSYEIRSQQVLLEKYEAVFDSVESNLVFSYGYDVYLKNNTISVFILLFILVNSTYIFLNDKSSGFDNILRVSKQGRGATFSAKLLTVLISTLGCTVLFHATTFLATGVTQGFSSPMSAIQSFSEFATVPYALSILQFIFVQVGLRALGFAVVSLVVSLFACLKFSNAISIGGGIVFSGINIFLFSRTYLGTVPAIKYINTAAMVETTDLLGFYRTLSFFGIPVSYLSALLFLSVALCIFSSILCAIFFCKNVRVLSSSSKTSLMSVKINKTIVDFSKHIKFIKVDSKRRSLTLYELKKNRILLVVFACAILILCRQTYVSASVGTMENYAEALYYDYIAKIQPLDSAARGAYMTEERNRIDEIISLAEKNKKAFESGNYDDPDVYFDYLKTLTEAKAKDVVFERVEGYVEYIEGKNAATGHEGEIIYSTGYEQLFGLSSDVLFFVAVLILCMQTFSVEYAFGTSRGGFSQILRTTKRGRSHTFTAKVLPCALMGGVIALAFRGVTILTVASGYILTDKTATLFSIESFSSVTSNMTIGQCLLVDFCIQGVIGTIIAAIICMISLFFKRPLAIISAGLFVLGIPEVLGRTVLRQFSDFSILSLTAPQGLLSSSAHHGLFGNELGYLMLICLMFGVVCGGVVILGRRKFCGFYNSHK